MIRGVIKLVNRRQSRLISNSSITINWKHKDGKIQPTKALVGQTLLQAAHKYNIELEGTYIGELSEDYLAIY